jgi:hypothetical protein
MSKRKLKRYVLALHLIFALVLTGCGGGGGGDNDPPSVDNTTDTVNQDSNDITAYTWMTLDCIQDNYGTYYKSLYQFTSDGQVLHGWQDFQDSSCTARADTNLLPSTDFGTYQSLGSQTLPDGSQGYGLRYTGDGESYDGFFTLPDNNTLCSSSNISFRTEALYIDPDDTSPSVDYEHCLSIYSSNNPNPNPNPDPNPNPNPDVNNTGLEGKWLLWNMCIPLDSGGYALPIYQFTEDDRLLYALAEFENDTCQGDSTASSFYEFDPPATYRYQGEATLPDGTQGHSIQLADGTETNNGYFIIDPQEGLCVSYSLELTVESSESTDIDYEHCMIRID